MIKEDRATPTKASLRIKHWSLFLSNYEYSLVFHNITAHANADAQSRLLLPVEPAKTVPELELVLLAEHLANSPVTASDIWLWMGQDLKLSRVLQYVRHSWRSNSHKELEPFST